MVNDAGDIMRGGFGILQMYANGEWKYVCDDIFGEPGSTGPAVACTDMGYGAPISHTTAYTITMFSGDTTVSESFFDGVHCTGEEERLANCPRIQSSDCGSDEGVYLTCSLRNILFFSYSQIEIVSKLMYR